MMALEFMRTKITENILYYCAVSFLPNIFLFFLYNNNSNEIKFSHCAVLAAALTVVSLCLFFLFRAVLRGKEGALLILLLFWGSFWLFGEIFFIKVIGEKALLLCLSGVIAAAAWRVRLYKDVFHKNRTVFYALGVAICALFVFNFAPAFYDSGAIARKSGVYELKTDFIVDGSLPRPDIYWFHMDEMMSFSAIEKYFGDAQETLKDELKKRGFVLNENAGLRAGYTQVAVPALTSPAFYDSYLGDALEEVNHLLRRPREYELNKKFNLDGLDLQKDIAPALELFHAFMAADYHTVTISPFIDYSITVIDRFYRSNWRDNRYKRPFTTKKEYKNGTIWEDIDGLKTLLTLVTPLSIADKAITGYINEKAEASWLPIPEHREATDQLTAQSIGHAEETSLYRMLFDSFSVPSPKLIYAINCIAHSPYNKLLQADNPNSVDLLYLPHYVYAADVMLNMIDAVLEQNPDAVIVLQGDHGIHAGGQYYMMNKRYPIPQILEMNHSVISAVRIPPQYDEPTEPLDPLDISRWLVNHFVGENYSFLRYSGNLYE